MTQTTKSDLERQAAAWDKQCMRVQLKYFVVGPRPGGYPGKWQRWLGTVSDLGDVTGGVLRRGQRTKDELQQRNED